MKHTAFVNSVPSNSQPGINYTVVIIPGANFASCNCIGFEKHGRCRHMFQAALDDMELQAAIAEQPARPVLKLAEGGR